MRIRMLSTRRGADDGVTLRTYEAGSEYELPETERGLDLAAVFIREGWAVKARPPAPPAEPPADADDPAPAAEPRRSTRFKPRGAP